MIGNQTRRSSVDGDHRRTGIGDGRIALRLGREQVARVAVLRIAEDAGDIATLDDLALGHHAHGVGEMADDAEVVGDEQHGHAAPLLHILEEREDLRLHGDVERRRGLVGDQQVRLVGDGHGDHHALALAARELVGIVVEARLGIGQADDVEQPQRLGAGGGFAEPAMRDDDLAHLLLDGVERIERTHRLLKDHRDVVAANAAQLALAHGGKVACP